MDEDEGEGERLEVGWGGVREAEVEEGVDQEGPEVFDWRVLVLGCERGWV